MRAFIFSLDAFIAFSLALIAIYSLIFFSTIPSSYYYLLTQGHFLAKDSLMALSATSCGPDYGCPQGSGSLLDHLVAEGNPALRRNFVENTIRLMVPEQFGIQLDIRGDGDWETVYRSEQEAGRLSVSSQVPSFGYSAPLSRPEGSVHIYNSCPYEGYGLDPTLITCGEAGEASNPSRGAPGDSLVPSSQVRLVRLTVFI